MQAVNRISRRKEIRAIFLLFILLLFGLTLAACDIEFNAPVATPTSRIPVPAANLADEPNPSKTPTVELKEAVEEPTSTKIPPTTTIRPSQEPTLEPIVPIPGMIGPETFPDDVNPLGGRRCWRD